MYIHQHLLDVLSQGIEPNHALIIYGPRRIGKTTLLKKFLNKIQDPLFVTGEDRDIQYFLSSQSIEKLRTFVGKHQYLLIDEAQVIPNIGLNLKLLVDHCPNLKIIATGSSAFDLANQIGEPLTGRKKNLLMFPLSQMELSKIETPHQTRGRLEERLIYGSYPEVILQPDIKQKRAYLEELTIAYLYKDILALDGIKKSNKISKILQLLAFQLGKEVSLTEIGQQVGLNKATVEHYLDLLEKSFVLIKVPGFSRNLRKEVSKSSKYYFYDTGVRNAMIHQFNALSLRNDLGELWENYLILERLKKQAYQNLFSNNYFWRTYDQQEIDWIEEREDNLHAYEFKWGSNCKVKEPVAWKNTYQNSCFEVIHQDNYLDFII